MEILLRCGVDFFSLLEYQIWYYLFIYIDTGKNISLSPGV